MTVRTRGWPLVGRSDELARVRDALRTCGGAVLAGPAGVGKTRLARELAAECARGGATVRWVTGTQTSAGIGLGAFAGLVGEPAGDPAQLLRTAMDALTGGRDRSDVLVCVDDAHHLDDLSAVLLLQLALQERATVLVTVRSREAAPGAVAALWEQAILPRLEVPPLSGRESAEVVAVALGGVVAPGTAERLSALARGNMLYLRQAIDGERGAGRLAVRDGAWTWDGGFTPSDELTDLVGATLADLAPAARGVLEVIAVVGPLPYGVLERVCGGPAVESAERAGVVEVATSGTEVEVRAYHPMFAEVCRSTLGHLAERRIRGEVALELQGDEPAVLLRRAVLAADSDLPADPTLLTAAAFHAIARRDWPLAQRLARAAGSGGGGSDAQLALAYALCFDLQTEAAEEAFADLSRPGVVLRDRPRVIMSRAAHSFWFLARPDEAKSLVASQVADTTDPVAVASLEAMLALFEVSSGDLAGGLGRLGRLRRDDLTDPMGRLCGAWAEIVGLGFTSGITDRRRAARAAYDLARGEFALSQPRIGLAQNLVSTLLLAGHVAEAEEVAATVDADVDVGLPGPRNTADTVLALAALGAGRFRRARALAAPAAAAMEGTETSGWALHALLAATVASALLGERAAAADGCRRLLAHRHPAHALYEPGVRLTQAWTEACAGAVSAGAVHALAAADRARDHGQPTSEVVALHVALRLGVPGLAPRIEALAPRVRGPRAPAVLAHADALARSDGPDLLSASRQLQDLGDVLGAADAAAHAAQAFERRGLRGSHAAALARATRLQAACDGARTPALVAIVQPLPLTAREREIATLAGQGLSNRQIADRLVVSVRTVEGHLYRAGGKVGVEHREEFAGLFEP